MIKEFVGTGKTVEEACEAAKSGLNAPLTADVKLDIIVQPKKKILGLFGGTDAQVKASYDDGKKEKKAQQKKPQKKTQEQKKNNNFKPQKNAAPAPAEQKPEKRQERQYPASVDVEPAKAYLATILDGFNVKDAKIEASYADGLVSIDVDTDDCGIIIGHHGDTLDNIQYLMSLVMKKVAGGYVRVSINIGDFREKRDETLRSLAKRNSAFVLRTGRAYRFDPMNPYERRIIHTTVQEIEGVESRSVGMNDERRVVIEPVGGAKVRDNYRDNYHGNRGRGRGRRQSAPQVDPNREKKVDRADLPKFGKIEVNND